MIGDYQPAGIKMSATQNFVRFEQFAPPFREPSPLREQISAAHLRSENECLRPLLAKAELPQDLRHEIENTARKLVTRLRAKGQSGGVDGLVKEYSLSSEEGVALMCLAEALLRIPDNATRDALIRDKIARGDWRSHIGDDKSIFVNAASWGLVVSGRLVSPVSEKGLGSSLNSLIKRYGEPVIRSGVKMAMRMMGEQFVTGETIGEALKRARDQEAIGFTYSYDMLGEAAMTMADADRYYREYADAIHAIGNAAKGRDIYSGPGISIKLSALHPRYERAQIGRVMSELLHRVRELAILARGYNIGLNIDAEEADRLELSLDILEELAMDPALEGWQGLGFVIQAYGKRCPYVIDWIVDLAERSGHRIMVRLVKGAYWDSEIKRAQVVGLEDFPVFTRKVHTDISYIACARKLLAAREKVFPQFATHNAQTLATIYHLAGENFTAGDYEFQCLHGMGEALYEEVVGKKKLGRPCRIYAPVGTHETLLAYLVRRLLENGANSSFVNQIWDEDISPNYLIADPFDEASKISPRGAPHEMIELPRRLYPDRENSRGIDLASEPALSHLSDRLRASSEQDWHARPTFAAPGDDEKAEAVINPADHRDIVGNAQFATPREIEQACDRSMTAFGNWAETPVQTRAACLGRAADLLESRMEELLGLIIREAGKSAPNAVSEVREAVDFLRYYANEGRRTLNNSTQALGPIVCISPWNFPLAIFTGQIAAALVAGNCVLAKPAEETPLIAAQAVNILHEAGIPKEVLQLLPGDGSVGAALVANPNCHGVVFTGSTEVAKLIQAQLAQRVSPDGSPLPLIAETGGQNAMVVDSSALPEQVVRDVMASAFDSAGQRCSALRILCVQEEIADELLVMLKGALSELRVGSTDCIEVDVGPVISQEARETINAHIARMQGLGCTVEQVRLPQDTKHGTFVAPTIIEIDNIGQLQREVFGPVLHVLPYRRGDLREVLGQINATGYGLTFGLHSRIDETIAAVTSAVDVGNIYVNRNVIGAIVGVQPFGGRGLSGTGPKAGGPLYIGRMVKDLVAEAPSLTQVEQLPGPVGEDNRYALKPRGRILLFPATEQGLTKQLAACKATGNTPLLVGDGPNRELAETLPASEQGQINWTNDWQEEGDFAHVLIEDCGQDIRPVLQSIAAIDGPIPIVQFSRDYRLDWMVEEVSISTDTTAAGGNANLMAVA
jgi:RHH-type proline utilization regulon transcriptional repressor/proline dehydrogenase/delta 1-pyrroline-5-carboxylate dehydrogenase